MRNKETAQCLDSMGRKAGEKVGMVGCHNMGGNQVCNQYLYINYDTATSGHRV